MNRSFLFLAGLAACISLHAQKHTRIGLQLEHFLRTAPMDLPVDLFLEGSTAQVEPIVRAHGGVVKMSMRNWTSARIPAGRVRELDGEAAIKSIQFTLSQPTTLNDSMRYKTRIDRVHNGDAPLPGPYTGDGTIMGIVDTGLDFTHPDFTVPGEGVKVLHYWSQAHPNGANTPTEFGYGQEWNKAAIDAGNCPATDLNSGGHGTTVAGTAAGNGNATGQCIGAAPASDLIIVSSNFQAVNWTSTVADGVKYVFDHASALGRPAVVNLSLGDYLGSHDGLDPAALLIDSMLMAAPGRAVVAAAGNSNCFNPYQLRMDLDADTSFSWIRTNTGGNFAFDNSSQGAYIDFWGEASQMNDIQFSMGADKATGGFADRGRIPFRYVGNVLDQLLVDTIWSPSGSKLAVCSTFTALRGEQYHLEMLLYRPDSAGYLWRPMFTGTGRVDAWDNNGFGLSEIAFSGLPSVAEYPNMVHHVMPTKDRGIVDSWVCSPHVITVANYNNELAYTACNQTSQVIAGTEYDAGTCSSFGGTRTDLLKPDVAAPGDITFTAAPMSIINAFAGGSGIFKLHEDCMHVRAGGTSIASPAVAGAVALYFEKCPTASHMQAKDAITSTAFGDALTGPVPNTRFGNGRLDAFAALNTTNFSTAITAGGDVCEGDSLEVFAEAGMDSYTWSNGGTEQIGYTQGEDMSVIVTNGSGCASYASDTLSFTVLPAPATPVVEVSFADLSTTSPGPWQWYFNGAPIDGATSTTYTATATGDYAVAVMGNNGCTSMSDAVQVIISGIGSSDEKVFALWPVPAHGVLNVRGGASGNVAWRITDPAGRAVLNGRLSGTNTQAIDVSSLSPGSYAFRLGENDGLLVRSFILR